MTIEERVEKLESELAAAKRSIRRLMAGAGLILGIFALFVAVRAMTGVAYSQAGGDVAKVIQAKRFEVIDDQGKTRAVLGLIGGWPSLFLYDEKGKTRASMGTFLDNGSLSLSDENGKTRASMALFGGLPLLSLFDEKGNAGALIKIVSGLPSLDLYDENHKIRAMLSVDKDGPSLTLSDENGKGRTTLGVSQTKTSDGRVTTYPESSLLLFGPDSKVIWSAPR